MAQVRAVRAERSLQLGDTQFPLNVERVIAWIGRWAARLWLCLSLLLGSTGGAAPTPLSTVNDGASIWTRGAQIIAGMVAAVVALSPRQVVASGVAFNTGDVFAAVGNSTVKHFNSTGALLDTLTSGANSTYNAGMAFDSGSNLYVTEFSSQRVSKFNSTGVFMGTFGSGYNADPESVTLNGNGNVYIGQADGTHQVLKFSPGGTSLATYSPAVESRGTDHIDLSADQCTLLYTSEGRLIKRFNVCTNAQLADFTTLPTGSIAYAVHIRPNGDVLVAATSAVYRVNSAGSVIQTYPRPAGETGTLFALNLDPNGTSFWTAGLETGNVYKINIASGVVEASFNAGILTALAGLTVFGEVAPGPPIQPAPGAGGSYPPGLPGTGNSSDPVNTLTGNFGYSHTDLAISGRGPSPVLVRSYNSSDTRGPLTGAAWISPFGPGWTHNYAMHLASPGDGTGDLILVGPQGRSDRYTALGGGAFAPPSGVSTTLAANLDGTYTASLLDQTKWTFDQRGRLSRVADRYDSPSAPSASVLTYNTNGQLATVSDPAGRGSLTLAYDPTSGPLTSVTDWTGRVVRYTYDTSGRLATVQDRQNDAAHRTTFAYDGTSQRLTSIADANSHTALHMTYDSPGGRVLHQWDALGADAAGQRTEFAYDASATCLTPTPPNPPVCATTVTYPVTSVNPTFNPQQLDTYTQGQITQHTSKPSATESLTETYQYTSQGFRSQTTDARGNTASFCYDVDYAGNSTGSRANLTRTIGPPPGSGPNPLIPLVTLVKYDSKNNVVETVSPKGISNGASVTCSTNLSSAVNASGLFVTDLAYDPTLGTELLSITRKYGDPELGAQTATTTFAYGDSANPGLVTRVTPPRGNTGPSPDTTFSTTLTYGVSGNQAGMLLSVTDPLGNKTTYAYDTVGRRTSLVDPNGNASGATPADHTWNFVYDNEDRLTQATAPAPVAGGATLTTSAAFDPVGNRVTLTDADGQITRYQYDLRDSLQQVLQSDNNLDPSASGANKIATLYGYDALGNLVRVDRDGTGSTDTSKEEVVDYAYDGLNRVRKETQYPQAGWPASPNGSTSSQTLLTQTTYDLNSNRLTLTDPLNQLTTFGYDALNRLVAITYTNPAAGTAATPNVNYSYDANGNRLSRADGTGTTTYGYDELDRLLSVVSPGPNTVGYRYDLDGNRTKIIYPDNTAVAYAFDKASRLQSLLDWANRSTSYTYFADGLLNTSTNVNATTAQFSYDNARRLSQVWNQATTGTISRHTYTLDNVGNRTRVDEVLPQLGVPGPIAGQPVGPSMADAGDESYQMAAAVSSAPLAQVPPSSPTPMPTGASTSVVTPTPLATSGPTATPTITPSPTTPVATSTPVSGLVSVALTDQSADPTRSFGYRATGNGAIVEAHPRDGAAGVQFTDSATHAQLRVELFGTPDTRQVSGSTTSATLGGLSVQWSVFADRVQQTLVLSGRPTGDRVPLTVWQRAMYPISDGSGGVIMRGVGGTTAFHVLAATATDTQGHSSTTHLVLGRAPSRIELDPSFLTTAAYPITIQWTTLFASATADVQPTAQQAADGAEAANTAAEDSTGEQLPMQAASFGMAGGFGSSTDPWSWGANWYGELGTGVTPGTGGGPTPAQIIGFGPVSGLSAGTNHALALKSDGSVWGWGLNESGQVGNPAVPGTGQPANPASATSGQSTPIQVVGAGGSGFLSNISAVSAGGTHSVALKSDGTVWAWGSNENGELGAPSTNTCTDAYGNFPCSLTPVQVQGPGGTGFLTGVIAVAAGDHHSLALKSDGSVWAWGYNAWGQLGSHGNTSSTAPEQVQSPDGTGFLTGVSAIAARGYFSLALKSDNTVWAWGANNNGELGNGTLVSRTLPAQVLGPGGTGFLAGATAISANHDGSLAVKSDGSVWTWGQNDAGQAGTGTLGDHTSPVQVVGPGGSGTLSGVTAISGGIHHSEVRKSDGTVWTWGDDVLGQLGYTAPMSCNSEPCSSTPQQVQGLGRGMTMVSAGFYFSLAASGSTRLASTSYSYDKLYRLTGVTAGNGTTTYSYDPSGNRLSKVLGGTTNYTYDKADRILTAGSTNYTVNNAGNQTARGSDSFSYDQANRLTSTTTSTGSGTYVYDGDGKRATKIVSGVTTTYVYDVGGGLPAVLDDGSRKYVWGNGLAYSVDKTSGAVALYHTDGLGSVRAITDNSASVTQTYQTDEFGVPTLTQGTSAQPFGFTGEQRDPEDGLMYLRARTYDPTIGRFLQRDTAAGLATRPCSLNRFTYAESNPVAYVDPSGLLTCSVALGGSFSSPASAGISVGIGFDDKGQVAVFWAPQVGGATSIGVSAGASVSVLNEPDVFHLAGPFDYVGVTASLPFFGKVAVSGEAVYDPSLKEHGSGQQNGWVGIQFGAQVGASPVPLPVDFHSYQSWTNGLTKLSGFQYALVRGAAELATGLGTLLDECQAFVQNFHSIGKSQVLQ